MMDRCELFMPEYDHKTNERMFLSRGRVWARVTVAHTHVHQDWGVVRNQKPPVKTLYTITMRNHKSCERGWRVRCRGKIYAVISEPIFRDRDFHQYFLQIVDEVDL